MTNKTIVHGSTFSGIGAPEVAAEMLGWKNAFHCEINPFGRAVLDYYFSNAESYEDITKPDFSQWRGKITVLTGGFPCQPFSYAGKRRGSEDNRYLWPFMLKCIQEVRPTWFVGENVAGITTMVFPCEDVKVGSGGTLFDQTDYIRRDERYVIEEICQQLEDCGYSVQPMLIPACAVGAPHRRDRIFFIAHRNDAADTSSSGRHDGDRTESTDTLGRTHLEKGERNHSETTRTCDEKPTPHPSCSGSGTQERHDVGTRSTELGDNRESAVGDIEILYPNNRWRTFPTVSPVYRGNDGFPFDVDNLTIPFSRWKKESLKAYGNAIVVQVIYRIFEAIDKIEQSHPKTTPLL